LPIRWSKLDYRIHFGKSPPARINISRCVWTSVYVRSDAFSHISISGSIRTPYRGLSNEIRALPLIRG
jgi:hypothetical protein